MDQEISINSGIDDASGEGVSPYRIYTAKEWSEFRADTQLTLSEDEVQRLRSMNDPISLNEVRVIYLSLSRLLSTHVEAAQQLFHQRRRFLNIKSEKTPFIIGIAGSVAVGKSTTARILKELMSRWPNSPKVDLITTDGFLYPNAELEAQGLMQRKGFPESFDRRAVLQFLSDIKAGKRPIKAPVYSHFSYDVMTTEYVTVDRPDILIFEGLNVLQVNDLPKDGNSVPFVSDFFDFSIYIDADEELIRHWYVERFMRLRETAFTDPGSYFHRFSKLNNDAALETATKLWEEINLLNLHENILPTRPRADLILRKGADHLVDQVTLRKL
jgi:type I pantothenate kinase